MPYKNPEDKKANNKLKLPMRRDYERSLSLSRFRAQGLEPEDINNQFSPLICEQCGKVTPRSSCLARHFEGCYYSDTPKLLRYPVRHEAKHRP
jgi:hypothetical protein